MVAVVVVVVVAAEKSVIHPRKRHRIFPNAEFEREERTNPRIKANNAIKNQCRSGSFLL